MKIKYFQLKLFLNQSIFTKDIPQNPPILMTLVLKWKSLRRSSVSHEQGRLCSESDTREFFWVYTTSLDAFGLLVVNMSPLKVVVLDSSKNFEYIEKGWAQFEEKNLGSTALIHKMHSFFVVLSFSLSIKVCIFTYLSRSLILIKYISLFLVFEGLRIDLLLFDITAVSQFCLDVFICISIVIRYFYKTFHCSMWNGC